MDSISPPSDELLDRYKHLRNVGRDLNSALIKQIPRTAISECGKKLKLIRGKVFVVGNESEFEILFDYCLYNYRRKNKNTIERYLENYPPPPLSDEMILLQAMVQSYYSLFVVEDIHAGKGATLRDMLRDKLILLMDMGMGESTRIGMVFAGRVLPLTDFYMTSGTFIPIHRELVGQKLMPILAKFLQHRDQDKDLHLSPSREAAFSAQIIRALLKAGALDYMSYRHIDG